MPPFNAARRDRLADAAIEILAREGARGLTHRAVDAEAEEPSGTTSRYFRTRDALLAGAVERVRDLHFADLAAAPRGPVDGARIGEHLAQMVYGAITTNRSRHLAILELFMEGTRQPALGTALAATRTAQIRLMCDIHDAAGVELTEYQASMLVTAITGLVHVALTTPQAFGLGKPSDVRERARALIEAVRGSDARAAPAPQPTC
jgi:DNA-binding transcriptional regulator YbjK